MLVLTAVAAALTHALGYGRWAKWAAVGGLGAILVGWVVVFVLWGGVKEGFGSREHQWGMAMGLLVVGGTFAACWLAGGFLGALAGWGWRKLESESR